LYNLRFLKPLDEDYLAGILNSYDLVAFIEEGVPSGGFGEYASAACHKCRAETLILAADEDFAAEGRAIGTRDELLKANGLDAVGICDIISRWSGYRTY
jgi:1-deoxy-D-xylulose-5-phosphate synthase